MSRDFKKFSKAHYDLLIIGGGINGAAIANLAAGCGLRVILVEKGDFASGTSTKTTKLMHGGIRYLEHFEFDLVRESLKERFIQWKSIPYLVKPLPFIIPVYKKDRRPFWMMKFGVWLYDKLGGKYTIEKRRVLTPFEITESVKGIKADDLVGGVMYYDAQMDDARVCLENILSAREKGAEVLNYVEAQSFLKSVGKVVGIKARDVITGNEFEIKAKRTVCTIGPWTNSFMTLDNPHSRLRVRTTKGIHIVYRGQFSDKAILLSTKKEKRIFFIIPWKGNSLIGTTDTDYLGSPDRVTVHDNDVQYLFDEAQAMFPEHAFKKENIITTFAGLRPLVHREGSPSEISRKHEIQENYSGVVFVMGGKYTTYRRIAIDCLKQLYKDKFIYPENEYVLYGSGEIVDSSPTMAERYNIKVDVIDHLKNIYGTRYLDVLTLTENNPSLKQPICTCSPTIAAQVVYAVKTEMAQTVEDVIWRRLSLGYLDCPTKNCQSEVQRFLKETVRF